MIFNLFDALKLILNFGIIYLNSFVSVKSTNVTVEKFVGYTINKIIFFVRSTNQSNILGFLP